MAKSNSELHTFGIGYYLAWGMPLCYFISAFCMTLDDMIHSASNDCCMMCRRVDKSKQPVQLWRQTAITKQPVQLWWQWDCKNISASTEPMRVMYRLRDDCYDGTVTSFVPQDGNNGWYYDHYRVVIIWIAQRQRVLFKRIMHVSNFKDASISHVGDS